jgi:hypothetical protein
MGDKLSIKANGTLPVKAEKWATFSQNQMSPGSADSAAVQELPYDDDPEWNTSFANSLETLQRLADKAQKDFEEGRTVELDPDNL